MATFSGINDSFDMSAFSVPEQRIIRQLSLEFYITRAAKAAQVGNSKYRAFLMRPAEGMSIALNVEREVVVLFSDYKTFEARTLRAFDLMYEQFDDVRVDGSLRFLISGDDNVEEIIRHYLMQNPEYPIIIPFHYAQFGNANQRVLLDAIRKNYKIRDLFGYQSPLKHEYFFFGRTRLVDNVLDLHKSSQNSALFGLRKSGKTSTIYAIQRRARAVNCRTVALDCQDPAVHARDYSSLLEYIVVQTRLQLGLRRLDITMGVEASEVSDRFRLNMDRTLHEAQSSIMLIFDEIENISPKTAASPHWRNSNDSLLFWQILRAFFQGNRKFKMTFCFVGTNPHLFEIQKLHDVDNPVYLFAPKTFIPMLDFSETQEMLVRLGFFMGLNFDARVASYIHGRFGGHPFFVRQLCSQIHKDIPYGSRPVSVSLSVCKAAEEKSSSDIQSYIQQVINSLAEFYPDELSMIEYLARGDSASFTEMADYAPSYVEHLLGYGIVVRRGADFEFAFDAVRDAVAARLKGPTKLHLTEKWLEISGRRNKIESEIRSFLFVTFRRMDNSDWERILQRSMSERRRLDLGNLSRREAFSRTGSPLYFMELLKLVESSGAFEDEKDQLSGILNAMRVVNELRIDAHAKDIDDLKYQELRDALSLLEGIFAPP